jgi:Cytochrome P450
LAMTKYPEVARKAQREIDSVVGSDRLPGFADRDHLPYLNALVKEVLRWNAVVPTGQPIGPLKLCCPLLLNFVRIHLQPCPTVSWKMIFTTDT